MPVLIIQLGPDPEQPDILLRIGPMKSYLVFRLENTVDHDVLKDNPELSAIAAMKKTRQMMKGHKFDYFWLCLSFIGWLLLGILTVGIGYIWLIPYMQTTIGAFYDDVKNGTAGLPSDAPYVATEKVE